jgi:hypothetical protein
MEGVLVSLELLFRYLTRKTEKKHKNRSWIQDSNPGRGKLSSIDLYNGRMRCSLRNMKVIQLYDIYKTQISFILQRDHNIAVVIITGLLRRRSGPVRVRYVVEKSGTRTGLFTGTRVSPRSVLWAAITQSI